MWNGSFFKHDSECFCEKNPFSSVKLDPATLRTDCFSFEKKKKQKNILEEAKDKAKEHFCLNCIDITGSWILSQKCWWMKLNMYRMLIGHRLSVLYDHICGRICCLSVSFYFSVDVKCVFECVDDSWNHSESSCGARNKAKIYPNILLPHEWHVMRLYVESFIYVVLCVILGFNSANASIECIGFSECKMRWAPTTLVWSLNCSALWELQNSSRMHSTAK